MKNQMSAQTSVKLLGRSINSNQAGMSLIGVVFIIFVFGAMLVLLLGGPCVTLKWLFMFTESLMLIWAWLFRKFLRRKALVSLES